MAVAGSDQDLFNLLTTSKCYVDTVDEKDKTKVVKARGGMPSNKPASKIATVAWYLAKRLATPNPPPPPPPPPPPARVAPRTYNRVPGGSEARFCVAGLPLNADGYYVDDYSAYDGDGRDRGNGRTPDTQIAGLRQSNDMNGLDPCTLYDGMTEWPAASYDR